MILTERKSVLELLVLSLCQSFFFRNIKNLVKNTINNIYCLQNENDGNIVAKKYHKYDIFTVCYTFSPHTCGCQY